MKTSDYGGTLTTSPSGNTYVADSDNQTSEYIAGAIKPAFGVIVSALLDAARATTSGSDGVGNYFDILTTDSRKIDESSVSTTKGQFISLPGLNSHDNRDPDDPTTTRILVQATQTFIAQG
jgi:hypothetical protein